MMYLQVIGGLIVLLVGAELLVRGSVTIARRLGISPLVIGMTVIALGTSAPEFVVTMNAAFAGAPGLAIGNIVGSNIANVWLILGITCLITPILAKPDALLRDSVILLGGTVLFAFLCTLGHLGRIAGVILMTGFIGFLLASYLRGTTDPDVAGETVEEVEEISTFGDSLPKALGAVAIGIVGLAWGSDMLVEGGITIARIFGVSEEVIGLTLFAFGTSVPELAASVVAAHRGHPDVAIGNVIGSNIFNMLGVGGAAALVATLPVADQIVRADIWVMLAATVMLLPVLLGKARLTRGLAAVFTALYLAYIGAQVYGVEKLLGSVTAG